MFPEKLRKTNGIAGYSRSAHSQRPLAAQHGEVDVIDPFVAFAPSLAGAAFLHESRGFEETQRRRIVAENPRPHAVDAFLAECEIQCQ